MAAPDRSATVRAYYLQHPEWFTAERHDENRRRSLPSLIAHLEAEHPSDRGQWGVLVKTDRNNKIPCDVLVWADTGEHFDVMDSQGGTWGPHGPITVNGGDAWLWAPADVVDPTGEERARRPPPYAPPNLPPDPDPPPVDLGPVLEQIADLSERVEVLAALMQRFIDEPPVVRFPVYEGTVAFRYLGTGRAYLEPK